MILSYTSSGGTYAHANNEVAVVIEQTPKFNDRGMRHAVTKRYTLRGELYAATQAAFTTALAALEAAYSRDFGTLTLYLDDGTTATAHVLSNNGTMGGVRVVKRPSYPKGDGAEYSSGGGRTYEIVLEADYYESSQNLMAWVETLTFEGGGENWDLIPVLEGEWPRWTLNTHTPYTVTQEGSAVGQFSFPVYPSPIWPDHEARPRRKRSKKGPVWYGNRFTNFEISWAYQFKSASELTGNPIRY